MASDCDRTVRIIKPDAEAILTNAVKCYFELGCSCENGVEFVGLHQNGDIAVVFSNPSDAQRVLETNHVIHGCPVQLALHGESEINDDCVSDQSDFVVFRGKERLDSSFDANVLPPYEAAIQGMAEPRGEQAPDEDILQNEDDGVNEQEQIHLTDTIRASGFNPSDHEDVILMFFENNQRSGGGPVKSIRRTDECTFDVTFLDSKDAVNVWMNSESQGLSWKGKKVEVLPLEPVPEHVNSHAVVVMGVPSDVPKEMLGLYFENPRFSHGGPVEYVDYDEGFSQGLVVFVDQKDADSVLGYKEHKLRGKELNVSRLQPMAAPVLITGPCEPNVLLLKGLPRNADREAIEGFVASAAGASVEEIIIGMAGEAALLRFGTKPDYMALVTHCIKRPLVGAMVQVQKVPLSRSVQVFGISKNHTEYLQLYLENHARSGGGDIESIEPAAVGDAIIVTFVDAGSVESVLAKKHQLGGELLLMSKYYESLGIVPPLQPCVVPHDPRPDTETLPPYDIACQREGLLGASGGYEAASDGELTPQKSDGEVSSLPSANQSSPTDTISVHGFGADIPQEIIEMYFENKSKSGGGPVKKVLVQMVGDNCHYMIKFKSSSDAWDVWDRSQDPGLFWNQRKLEVRLLEPIPENISSQAVLVKNFSSKIHNDILPLYLSNKKASNGGNIESKFFDGSKAVIVFADQKVAKDVSQKKPHTLSGQTLDISLLESKMPPELLTGPCEPNTLLMTGRSTKAGTEAIKGFVHCVSRASITDIILGPSSDKILLIFSRSPDYKALIARCMARPLVDTMVQVHKVPLSKSVQVLGISKNKTEFLRLYLENHAESGGGAIESIHSLSSPDAIIVTFMDSRCKSLTLHALKEHPILALHLPLRIFSAVASVLSRPQHRIGDDRLTIARYYDCLGVRRPQ